MRTITKIFLAAFILGSLPLAAATAAAPTKDEVVAVVKKAVETFRVCGGVAWH